MLQHGAQILGIEQQQAVVVGDLEHQLQHAFLGIVQVQHARQQQRAEIGHGGPHRMALLPYTSQKVTGQAAHAARPASALQGAWPFSRRARRPWPYPTGRP
jgi:hypothetical protein